MEDKGITAEQLMAEMQVDFKALAVQVAAAMNAAKAGRIIADTEEPVRDASAVFRERVFEKALSLLQAKQEAFSPSAVCESTQNSQAQQQRSSYYREQGSLNTPITICSNCRGSRLHSMYNVPCSP
jgi:hypothetical protein